ncbi:MAG TPA: hypothetical protein VL382_03535 [Terriglobales bacterium]|nr:hypothetical protein [Terriglobales bacterium]
MALRTRVLATLLFVLLLAVLVPAQKKGGVGGDGGIQVLLPDAAFSGGLITGVVVGDDDQPVANREVTIAGGFPATLTGEVVGDEPDKTSGKTPGPPQTGEKNPGPTGVQPPGVRPTGMVGPVDTPQACARLIQQAQGIIGANQGSDHILIGLLLPAVTPAEGTPQATVTAPSRDTMNKPVDEAREAATSPGGIIAPTDSVSGGHTWLRANGGGVFTDANGRFAFCATPDAGHAEVGLADGSVHTAVPLSQEVSCDAKPPQFFQPGAKFGMCGTMKNAVLTQGGHQWRVPSARAFSPNGDRAVTTALVPRDLGSGVAQLSFSDDHGQQQSFTGGVFKIVNAQIDRDKLRSHQDAGFSYDLSFAGFGPEYGQTQFGPEYGHKQLCVNVSTVGPIVLTSPAGQQLTVNGDGHATVKGKIRATQVAPGSAVPFGITLHVLDCATGQH